MMISISRSELSAAQAFCNSSFSSAILKILLPRKTNESVENMEGGDNNIYISEMSFVADFSNTVAKLSQQQNAMRYECFAVVRVIFSFR